MTNSPRTNPPATPWTTLIGAALSGPAVSATLYPVAKYYASGPCVADVGDSACTNAILANLAWMAASLVLLPVMGWLVLRLRRVDWPGTIAFTALLYAALGLTPPVALGWLNSILVFVVIAGLVVVVSYALAYRLWASNRLSYNQKVVLSLMPIILLVCLSIAPFILPPLLQRN